MENGGDFTYTKRLANYIREKGIALTQISAHTSIPYSVLRDSLSSNQRNRPLRIDEFIAICKFLEKDPMDFVNDEQEVS